ncbi:exocyst subunit exo70 family protein E2 [Euphorbia peplus]|nr:exocyst subunit exo70 family protein E2 [Euphorbia peplus]
MPPYEVEEHIVAATKHILKALEACKDISDDFKIAIKNIDSHLSTMEIMTASKGREFVDIEEKLKCAERKILEWKSNPLLIWDSGPMEVQEYLQAVNQILMARESLGGVLLSKDGKARDISFRAQCLLQLAMLRLEEELCHILVQHKKHIESPDLPSHSPASVVIYDESFSSVEDEIGEEISLGDRNGSGSVSYTVDLIDPHIIPDIKSIVHVMSASSYIHEFCEIFISNRKDALYEYLSTLGIEKFSIEDVLVLGWDRLNTEIKKWIWATKSIIRVYLTSEKRLCEQILGDYGSVNSFCFTEISKGSILCLLNFGQAVAMGPRKPEKLVCLLNMYEAVTDLHLEIDGMFSEDEGSLIRIEFHELLQRLVDTLTGTFLKFRNAISSDASTQPFAGGGIHPLTKYVMNYMTLLTEYCDALNLLLKDEEVDDSNEVIELENGQEVSSSCCPLACHLRSITSTLESNLVDKSKLYKDDPLQYIFLMNNMHYMVQKVKNSKLRILFGDKWIRRHNGKFMQHATSYVRSTWGSVVSTLRDDGRTSLKERCRRFSNAFEEVYKIQTRWWIPDQQLREDLQISTSQKVIPAYRNFLGNNNTNVSERYVKYTADDLEELLLDLFVGAPRSLRNSRRR